MTDDEMLSAETLFGSFDAFMEDLMSVCAWSCTPDDWTFLEDLQDRVVLWGNDTRLSVAEADRLVTLSLAQDKCSAEG